MKLLQVLRNSDKAKIHKNGLYKTMIQCLSLMLLKRQLNVQSLIFINMQNFVQQMVMQWQDAYINYMEVEQSLRFVKNIYMKYHEVYCIQNQEKHIISELPASQLNVIKNTNNKIAQVLQKGFEKYKSFYDYKKAQIVSHSAHLQIIITQQSKTEIVTHEDCEKRHEIKQIIKVIYTNCHYLRKYMDLNQQIYQKLKQFRNTYILPFLNQNHINPIQQQESQNSEIYDSTTSLLEFNYHNEEQEKFVENMEHRIKFLYEELVFFDKKKKQRLQSLGQMRKKETSKKSYCLIGFYSGIAIVAILTIILLLAFNLVEIDYDNRIDSMNYVFPMFRGVGLLILYLWGMAWNSYGFQQYRINYQLILEYGGHYSKPAAFIKRASFFTLVLFFMLLIYFIGLTYNVNKDEDDPRFQIEYTPFVVWLLYVGYIFFPNRDVFNPEGRKYFYRVLKEVFKSPFFKMSFLISWVTDQSVSFVVPIKDLAYTICFYTSDFSDGRQDDAKNCLQKSGMEGFLVAYFIALSPLIFRMAQCYRQAVQDTGKFVGHLQMWNFGKYLSSVVTATFSYFSTRNDQFIYAFIISSLVSTIYAYCWDLKYDWGLLEENSKHRLLRNRISYRNPRIYYSAIFFNLILRLAWTLTIAPFILTIVKSPLIPFITGLLEILRRCMWNFFRVQKEHIANCNNYIATKNVDKLFKHLDSAKKIDLSESEIIPYFNIFKLQKSLLPSNTQVLTNQQIQALKQQFQSLK